MELVRFDSISKSEYESYMTEWELSNEKIVPYAVKRDKKAFEEMTEIWRTDETDFAYQKGFVPSTLYF